MEERTYLDDVAEHLVETSDILSNATNEERQKEVKNHETQVRLMMDIERQDSEIALQNKKLEYERELELKKLEAQVEESKRKTKHDYIKLGVLGGLSAIDLGIVLVRIKYNLEYGGEQGAGIRKLLNLFKH